MSLSITTAGSPPPTTTTTVPPPRLTVSGGDDPATQIRLHWNVPAEGLPNPLVRVYGQGIILVQGWSVGSDGNAYAIVTRGVIPGEVHWVEWYDGSAWRTTYHTTAEEAP